MDPKTSRTQWGMLVSNMFLTVSETLEPDIEVVLRAVSEDVMHRAAITFFATMWFFYESVVRTLLWAQQLPNLKFGCFLQRDECTTELDSKRYCLETETVVPGDQGDGYSYFLFFGPSLAFVLLLFGYLGIVMTRSTRTLAEITGKKSNGTVTQNLQAWYVHYIRHLTPLTGLLLCGLSYLFSILRNSDFIDWDWAMIMIPANVSLGAAFLAATIHLMIVTQRSRKTNQARAAFGATRRAPVLVNE